MIQVNDIRKIVESGTLRAAHIIEGGGLYYILIDVKRSGVKELASARNPYERRSFKSIDGAANTLKKLGISTITLTI